MPSQVCGFSPSQSCGQLCSAADGNPLSASQTSPFQGSTRSESQEKALASPFGRGVIPLIGEMSAKQTKGSGRGTSRTKSVGFFGEGYCSLNEGA